MQTKKILTLYSNECNMADQGKYIQHEGVLWEGVIKGTKRSTLRMQAIFEAITNAFEAIALNRSSMDNNGQITIDIHLSKNLFGDKELAVSDFNSITISDNGIGFDSVNFERVFRFKDTRKGFNNRGSGRIQFLHFCELSKYTSYFSEDGKTYERLFTLSKNKEYLKHNSIIFEQKLCEVPAKSSGTVLTFDNLLDDKDKLYILELTVQEIKDMIINRYLMFLCAHRDTLPLITINKYAGDNILETDTIEDKDIPEYDKEDSVDVYYSQMSTDMKRVENTSNKETFSIQSYIFPKDKLQKNEIKLTSKNEIVENIKLKMDTLAPDDDIDGNKYLFLISSSYINDLDVDTRGEFAILNKTEFKKEAKEYGSVGDQILLDDIEGKLNSKIHSMYSEIKDKADLQKEELRKLKEMFLLNEETISSLKSSLNEPEDKILEKVYCADAKIIAEQDVQFKKQIELINDLNPNTEGYEDELSKIVDEFVKNISIQSRTTLSRYVARRKLVIDLLSKILDKKLAIQGASPRNEDEKLIHNLIFKQGSNESNLSDLWLLNEEFIYFKGCSEQQLNQITINGLKLFRDDVTEEEQKYLLSLGEDRTIKRPDILLFPDEGKCIIVELKNPNVNISAHLNQINNYATLIRNFTTEFFDIDTFYGYYLGESINPRDVRSHDADFKEAHKFKYLFRANKTIAGENGKKDGSLYTEVIQFSILRDRALARNKIFIDKIITPQ